MNRTEARELREERARIANQMSELATGGLKTSEDRTKFDAFNAAQKELKERIDRIESVTELNDELRGRGAGGTGAPPAGQPGGLIPAETAEGKTQREKDYRAAYKSYLKYGLDSKPHLKIRGVTRGDRMLLMERAKTLDITKEELERELRVVTGGAGLVEGLGGGAYPGATSGFFVPVGFVDEIEQAMKYYGPMLDGGPGMPRILPTDSGQPLPFPTSNDVNVVGELIAEQTTVSQGTVNMGNIIFGAYKFSTRLVQVSLELLQDSAFDIEEWLRNLFAERLGRILNTYMTTGTGGGVQPNGILTAAFAGPTFVGAGANDGVSGANTIGTDDLTSLEHSVDIAYRRGAMYMMHDTTLEVLKKQKDKYGRPLWKTEVAVGAPETINGYRYAVNNDMPPIPAAASSPAAQTKTILFGQLPKYLIRRVKSLDILRLEERFAEFGQIAFLGFARYDGNLLDAGTHPVTYGVTNY